MSHRNSNLAYLAAIAAGLVVAYPFAMSLLSNKNGLGFLILLGVPMISVILCALVRKLGSREPPSSIHSEPQPTESNRGTLAAFAAIAAPCVGLIAGLIFASQAHPLDKVNIVVALTFLGLIAGGIVSLALLASSGFK